MAGEMTEFDIKRGFYDKIEGAKLGALITVNIEDVKSLTDDQILNSKRMLNKFLEESTGFTAKQRMDRAKKKAKEGKL